MLSLSHGNYITQHFRVDTCHNISSVHILTNGYIPELGTISLEVYENDSMILQKYYDTSVLTDYGWSKLPVGSLPITINNEYYLKLYSDIEDEGFNLIVVKASSDVDSGLSLNGYLKDQVINFK